MVADYRTAGLGEALTALMDWCVKLTRTPGEMRPEDLDALRKLGWTDSELSAACFVASYFNFINRVAEGLGVDEEEWMKDLPPLGVCAW